MLGCRAFGVLSLGWLDDELVRNRLVFSTVSFLSPHCLGNKKDSFYVNVRNPIPQNM